MEHLILKIAGLCILLIMGSISLIKPLVLRSTMAVHIMTEQQYKIQMRVLGGFFIVGAVVWLLRMV